MPFQGSDDDCPSRARIRPAKSVMHTLARNRRSATGYQQAVGPRPGVDDWPDTRAATTMAVRVTERLREERLMRKAMNRFRWQHLWATVAVGGLFFLNGCDDETRTAVENGIIDTSSSFLGALLQALIQLAGETESPTAQVLIDSAARFCA